MTELEYDNLKSILRKRPITDAKAFYQYLCKLLPAAALAGPLPDEKPFNSKAPYARLNNFTDKAMCLVDELSHMPNGRLYAFRGYALLATKVFRPQHPRCKASRLPTNEVEDQITLLTKRPTVPKTVGLSAEQPYPNYFDCATHVREMYEAMGERCFGARMNNFCHHVSDMLALHVLQERAYSEMRAKVFLTAGSQLPVELTEQIFEDAMRAEGLSMHPEPVIVSPTEPMSSIVPGVPDSTKPADLRSVRAIFVCQKVAYMNRHEP